MKYLIFVTMTFLSALSNAGVPAPVVDTSVLQRTFEIPGPNCFSTALRVTGMYPTFRGVDIGEFSAFIKNECKEVTAPRKGDIGTYAFPNGGAFQHAFVYVDAEKGIEKAGVDYLVKSPVTENLLVHIDYTRIASPECRQYSAQNLSLCSNVKRFYRCTKPEAPTHALILAHNKLVADVELEMMSLIEGQVPKKKQLDVYVHLEENIARLRLQLKEISNLSIDPSQLEYYLERMSSLDDQMIYIKNSLQLIVGALDGTRCSPLVVSSAQAGKALKSV